MQIPFPLASTIHTDWGSKIFPLFLLWEQKTEQQPHFCRKLKKEWKGKGGDVEIDRSIKRIFQGHHTNKEGHVVRRILLRLVLRNLLKDPQEGHQIRFLLLRQIQLLNQVEELHRVIESQ